MYHKSTHFPVLPYSPSTLTFYPIKVNLKKKKPCQHLREMTNSSVNLSVLCMYHSTSLLFLHLHHLTVCYSGTGDWDVSHSIPLAPSAQTDFTCKYSLQCIIQIVDVLLFLLQCQYCTLIKTLGYPAVSLSLGGPAAVDLLGLSP